MKYRYRSGFTLVELLIVVVIVGILAAIAIPSYHAYVIRAARQAVQTELLELAGLQEKIYLNSDSYTISVIKPYNGSAGTANGLGKSSGISVDGKYDLSFASASDQTYTLQAVPVTSKSQAGDGDITISENGQRLWGGKPW